MPALPRAGHAPDAVPPWKSDLNGHRSYPRRRFPGEPWIGTAGAVRAVLLLSAGRPDFREEGSAKDTAGNLCAPPTCRSIQGSDLPARLMTAIDLRATPQIPAIDLP